MIDLADLKRRVEEASGPDRELDAAIGRALAPTAVKMKPVYRRGHYIGNKPVLLRMKGTWPEWTASLDATVALIERVMPGFARHVAYIPNIPTRKTDAEARLWLPAQQTRGWKKETFSGDGKTEPLALLAALLSACEGGAK